MEKKESPMNGFVMRPSFISQYYLRDQSAPLNN